jgi:hypothetical protein
MLFLFLTSDLEHLNLRDKHIEDTQMLVTEIEMLKSVLFLVCRKERKEDAAS